MWPRLGKFANARKIEETIKNMNNAHTVIALRIRGILYRGLHKGNKYLTVPGKEKTRYCNLCTIVQLVSTEVAKSQSKTVIKHSSKQKEIILRCL